MAKYTGKERGGREEMAFSRSPFTILGYLTVKQLPVTGASGRYYLAENQEGIKSYIVDIDVGIDYEYELGDDMLEEMEGSENDSNDFDGIGIEKRRVVTNGLEHYRELELGMSFEDINEAREMVGFYALVNKKKLKVKKSDTTRVRYICQTGCPFVCLVSKDKNTSTCTIKTLKFKHLCDDCFDNPRAGYKTLALYFKKHVKNNPKYAVKDMRGQLENTFQMNVSKSKLKRAKRLVLERLEGSFRDEYNKLEAYGQEIRHTNPETGFVINLSKDSLEEGKRRFLRMYTCFQALKKG
ncbi:PREDICTED: uncharacterized protein LOC109240902 [Nicotiana attenuata]|uniref:uncharacterized protein LOC109240902 n=1 Tax=Nicotiana attenuata TaxID=49451 RepID=UPI000904BC47|nr:PREDICTED: uncharacterized protein LOC109240902 [Nicotiana attenuata]